MEGSARKKSTWANIGALAQEARAFARMSHKTPVNIGTSLPRKILTNSKSWNNIINPFNGKTFPEIDQMFVNEK